MEREGVGNLQRAIGEAVEFRSAERVLRRACGAPAASPSHDAVVARFMSGDLSGAYSMAVDAGLTADGLMWEGRRLVVKLVEDGNEEAAAVVMMLGGEFRAAPGESANLVRLAFDRRLISLATLWIGCNPSLLAFDEFASVAADLGLMGDFRDPIARAAGR